MCSHWGLPIDALKVLARVKVAASLLPTSTSITALRFLNFSFSFNLQCNRCKICAFQPPKCGYCFCFCRWKKFTGPAVWLENGTAVMLQMCVSAWRFPQGLKEFLPPSVKHDDPKKKEIKSATREQVNGATGLIQMGFIIFLFAVMLAGNFPPQASVALMRWWILFRQCPVGDL